MRVNVTREPSPLPATRALPEDSAFDFARICRTAPTTPDGESVMATTVVSLSPTSTYARPSHAAPVALKGRAIGAASSTAPEAPMRIADLSATTREFEPSVATLTFGGGLTIGASAP